MRTLFATPEYVKWLPEYLREAGYYTANIGKHDYNTLEPENSWSERVKNKNIVDGDRSKYFKQTGGDKPFFTIVNLYQQKAFAKSDDKINTSFITDSNSITKTVQCKTEVCWKALENLIVENSGASD